MYKALARIRDVALGLALSGALWPSAQVHAEVSGATMDQYTSFPVIITESATPLVMLTMSRDHQYWFKAYNDYTDLDNDGDIETTYKHSVDYFGYFDHDKCYDYINERFEPKDFTSDKYCDTVNGQWSGNFLNWAAMTRMDIVRKILYGGKRFVDEPSSNNDGRTVLERAHLPTDAHSFAKHYSGDDLPKLTPFQHAEDPNDVEDNEILTDQDRGSAAAKNIGLTICNATEDSSSSEKSHTTTNPPLLRVTAGNYSLWASNERWQCRWFEEKNDTLSGFGSSQPGSNGNLPAFSGIDAYDDNPEQFPEDGEFGGIGSGFAQGEYTARVLVCDQSFVGGDNNEGCNRYPDGNFKPIGLIQQYGEEELIHFGLMTTSYENNISGGVVRKNVGGIAGEVNVDTDGTFIPQTGNDVGIINTLDTLRIYGYRYDNGTYRGSQGDNCTFQLTTITEGECTSWGNPISELYLEAIRYFAGLSPTPDFRLPGSGDRLGLKRVNWTDPLSDANACARLNTVTFNASVSSYDDDQMSGSDLPGTPDFSSLTDNIGNVEGFEGNKFFIGRNGTDNNELCNPKTINGLGNALGLCPEAPTVLGSYLMSGAAHYAHTNDIRDGLGGTQSIDAFAVALSTNVPKVTIPVPDGDPVTILPAYRNLGSSTDPGGGSLVDFKIVNKHAETAPGSGIFTGKYYANWEDSEQGGDYDQDEWGVIEYELDTTVSPPTLKVTTNAISESTSNPQVFGFVISGTTQDGFHAYSGIDDAQWDDPDPTIPDCFDGPRLGELVDGDCDVKEDGTNNDARFHTFTVGQGTGELLPEPLFLAAKWGGFNDENGNDIPDLQSEWDRKDADGNLVDGGDGQPDNYFFVTNPLALQRSLTQVFETIVERTASGTAAAVVANTQTGSGAAFQALYEPKRKDANKNEVSWIGTVHALWIDEFGLLREDNPSGTPNGTLEGYNTDPVVDIFFDEDERKTKIRRFTSSDDATFIASGSTVEPLDQLSPIWDARDELAALGGDIKKQRSYGNKADKERHVITWMDQDYDGEVDGGEQVELESSNVDSTNFGWFDVATVTEAQNLVDYIRGEEISGFRNRTVDIDDDGSTEVMRLGDIIHSTPTPVGAPAEAFDVLLGDLTYADFRQQYAQRRQVVLVGANDGMLHAFNAGFFSAADKEFKLSVSGETEHPLGAELWAYAPKNLLPHLKWLKDPDYSHVYYVDAKPRVFDAKIFEDDATHPGGWGTVAVVGFRFGGGDLTTDAAGDGLAGNDSDGDNSDDVTVRSAYAVLDITDPEQPPKVLAEITHPDLAYTTSFPAVAFFASSNKWFLIFGSGPTELASATSTQNGKLFVYQMQSDGTGGVDFTLASGFPRNNGSNAFIGDPLVVDWDLNGEPDTLYYGLASGTPASPDGEFRKLAIKGAPDPGSWPVAKTMLNVGQPFTAQPTATVDEKSQRWVFASTGRFYVNADKASTPQQTLYGVIDGSPNSFPINGTGLVDVTAAQVFADGSIQNVSDPGGGTDPTTLTALITTVEDNGGWKLNYDSDGTNPAQRGVTTSALVGGILFNPAFTPSEDLCGSEGESELFGVFFKTGTALDNPQVFGGVCTDGGESCPESELESTRSIVLGAGLASSPSVHSGSGLGEQKVTVVEQTSTGAIVLEEATTAGGVTSGEVSWREYE